MLRLGQSLASELTHEMTMTDFTPLDVDDMMAAYRHSKSRVILLDYGGSLLEKEVRTCVLFPGACLKSPAAFRLLHCLCLRVFGQLFLLRLVLLCFETVYVYFLSF